MKSIFLFLAFLSLAHADDGCSKLLSPKTRLEVSIRDLSQLRYELDLNAASGADSLTAQLLKAAYDKKYAELLELEPKLDEKVRELIRKIQLTEERARSSKIKRNKAESDALNRGMKNRTADVTTVGQIQAGRTPREQEMLSTGEILFLGSFQPNGVDSTTELFDPSTGKSEFKVNLPKNWVAFGHTRLENDTVLISGGNVGPKNSLKDIRILDPKKKVLKKVGTLLQARSHHTQVLLPDGKVMLVGGWQQVRVHNLLLRPYEVADIEIFDPLTQTSEEILSPFKFGFKPVECLILHDGTVLANDGEQVLIIDPVEKTISRLGYLNLSRTNYGQSLLHDGRVLITGGWSQGLVKNIEIIDPVARTIVSLGDLSEGRSDHGQVTLSDGSVALVGGLSSVSVTPTSTFEVINIDQGDFFISNLFVLKDKRSQPRLHLQSDETVLVVGGTDEQNAKILEVEKIKFTKKERK